MKVSDLVEYDRWWDEISRAWECILNHDDILALEYYPYATYKDEDIDDSHESKYVEIYKCYRKDKWDIYAKCSLENNINFIKFFLKMDIPIYIFYKAELEDRVPELKNYKNIG